MFINLTDKLWRGGGGSRENFTKFGTGRGRLGAPGHPNVSREVAGRKWGGGGVKIKKRGWDITRETYA